MGPNRELKFALEKYWKNTIDKDALMNSAHDIKEKGWKLQKALDKVTVGDFHLYDGVLSWTEYLGVVPKRFQNMDAGIDRMFAMARGMDGATALSKYTITSTLICDRAVYPSCNLRRFHSTDSCQSPFPPT